MAINETAQPEKVLKVSDIALHLHCTNDTVYQLVRKGELRSIRVGRLVRVPESSLRDFIARGGE